MNKIRIVLADDHIVLRQGLRLLINSQPNMEVIGEAVDGAKAVELASQLKPDVVIMDVSMPNLNGHQAMLELKKTCPDIKVLVLTRHSESSYLHQLLQSGVAGYVLKQSEANELVRAIGMVSEGHMYLDPTITGKLLGGLVGRATTQNMSKVGNLSERERDVLRLIAQGYSNKEIAAKFGLSVKTIEAHKANAMNKLELHSRVDIVHYAIFQGWLETA